MNRTTLVHTMVAVAVTASLVPAAGCGRKSAGTPAPELPTRAISHWTAVTELFMEHPPLVAGEKVRLAVHLTTLSDFKPLNEGRPSIELRGAAGATVTWPGTEPLRPGAFRVEGVVPPAGTYTWSVRLQGPRVSDVHDLGTITVYPTTEAAKSGATVAEGVPAIAYLKEQQWTTDFATTVVKAEPMRRSVRVPAVVVPPAGGEAVIAAPASGRLVTTRLPQLGDRRRRGGAAGVASSLASRPSGIVRFSSSSWPRRGPRSVRPRRSSAAPSGWWPRRRCRHGASKMRRARSAWRAPRWTRRRPAWRSATRRCAPAAPRPAATPSSCAPRSADRCCRLGDAWCRLRGRRRALPHRPDRPRRHRGPRPAVGARPARPGDRRRARDAGRFQADPGPHPRPGRFGRARPEAARLRLPFRGGQRRRPPARRAGGHRDRVPAGERDRAGRAARRPSSWKPAGRTCSCRSAARASSGASWRSGRATATSSGSRPALKPGERVVTRGAYDVQLGVGGQGAAGRRPRPLR